MKKTALSIDPTEFKERIDITSEKQTKTGLNTVKKILIFWGFNEDERAFVLDISQTNGEIKFTKDQRTRISLILNIYKLLKTSFLQDSHHQEWINSSNASFDNLSPKTVMLSGALLNLYDIKNYLDEMCA